MLTAGDRLIDLVICATYAAVVLALGVALPWTWSVVHVVTILALAAFFWIPTFLLVGLPAIFVIGFVLGHRH